MTGPKAETAPDTVMIFAAGFGTRMGALTRNTPKPMIEIAGRPLLDHALDLVAQAGVSHVVVNTHYLAEQIHAHLADRDVSISHESPRILDTGGGLRKARTLIEDDNVFTLNPDAAWSGQNPLRELQAQWNANDMDALLLCVPLANAIGRAGPGDFGCDAQGRISRGGDLVYTGAQILRLQALDAVAEDVFSLNAVWDRLIALGRAKCVVHDGRWCDVGHPGGIALAETLLETHEDV